MKFWISIGLTVFLLFIGGYVIYFKEQFISFNDEKYYKNSDELFISKDGNTILSQKHIADDKLIMEIFISNDNVIIEITNTSIEQVLYIEKDDINYHSSLEYNEEEIDHTILKYAILANDYYIASSTFNEDYTVVIYIILSLFILFAITVMRLSYLSIDKKSKSLLISNYSVIFLASIILIVSLFINILLIIGHL